LFEGILCFVYCSFFKSNWTSWINL
jgi:hypothetical protein